MLFGCTSGELVPGQKLPSKPIAGGATDVLDDADAESVNEIEAAPEPEVITTEEPSAPQVQESQPPTEVQQPAPVAPILCGGPGDSCYTNQTALAARLATTPSGKSIVLQRNAQGFDVWLEKGGTRGLKADGFDEWQMQLSLDGKSVSGQLFAAFASIAGRVCPPNVYAGDANKFAVNRCLFYDAGVSPSINLNAAGTSQVTAGSIGLGNWDLYNGGLPRWYVGNVQLCAAKGMRLPTAFETNLPLPADFPSVFPVNDGTAVFAGSRGVPSVSGGGFQWTATSATDNTGYYATWRNAELVFQYITFAKTVRCVVH